ncbi:MFS transporter [Dongia sedimenti]|uniref:MFS transporter n=1 Tax=Dongia sedimenti TaxID=3064282 RepID=A0ABU0YG22_9PROT|nr:MFS transporter [Rhodospirillaceae bacterium R-7]
MTPHDTAAIAAQPPQFRSAPIEEDGLPAPRRYLAMVAILTAFVLVVLDIAIANLALPTIAETMAVTPSEAVWVVTSYQMAIVMFLLPAGAAGESFGYRRVFVIGIAIFVAASALCTFAPSLPWLVAARFIQGVGSAAVMAIGVGLLRFIYPMRLLGAALGWNAITIALTAAAGPSIGAAILSVASWPWLFAINIPLGVAVLLTARALPQAPGSGRGVDLLSIVLNAGVFGALILGIDRAVTAPWTGAVLLVASAAGLVVLVRRELPRAHPIVPFDLLRLRSFRLSVVASICCFTGQMASLVALPFYLQHGLGQSAGMTGLYLTAWPLTVAVAGPLSGRLSDRFSTGTLCAVGGACLAASLLLTAFWPLQDNLLPLVPFMMLGGLGFGFFQTPNNRNMLLAAPKARSGAAGAMQGMARLTGQTAGSVLMLVLFGLLAAESAPRLGLAIGAGFALAGGLVSLLRAGGRH